MLCVGGECWGVLGPEIRTQAKLTVNIVKSDVILLLQKVYSDLTSTMAASHLTFYWTMQQSSG